uniref:SPRY domain-containing protein 3 n=1 Tax=Rhipicephalus appendiculatus TaxID=34631 RepID=A0A131YTU0_RHIAP
MELERRLPATANAVLKPCMDMRQLFVDNIFVEDDMLCYDAGSEGNPGLYVGVEPASPSRAYFEVELIGMGTADLVLGFLCPSGTGMHQWDCALSLACRVSQGRLSECESCMPGVACRPGDRIGCGLAFDPKVRFRNWGTVVTFFITHNGKEVGRSTSLVSGRLHPAIVMRDPGHQVRLLGEGRPTSCSLTEDALMCVDSNEDEWLRLHDVHLNGPVLEYSGRGTSMVDVGLAQTRSPLSTTNHYFELEILDPGEKCCIAIGLAHRDYPRYRHPGWNEGSIAYHADDGKIFVGSGVGSRFGPKCQKGDIMGCGILFPREYVEPNEPNRDAIDNDDQGRLEGDDNDEYDFMKYDVIPLEGTLVQVFFTLNGVHVGRREMAMPQGGLFPTVGMLSRKEKVKVDLHPLTG